MSFMNTSLLFKIGFAFMQSFQDLEDDLSAFADSTSCISNHIDGSLGGVLVPFDPLRFLLAGHSLLARQKITDHNSSIEAATKRYIGVLWTPSNGNDLNRSIHLSAAGADPNSQSMRLRTKWIGEQEVEEIFPDVTILRPTNMFKPLDGHPTPTGKWEMQRKMFNNMNLCRSINRTINIMGSGIFLKFIQVL